MTWSTQDLRTSIQALVEQAQQHLGDHPPPEELVACCTGEQRDRQVEPLRDHLSLWPECTWMPAVEAVNEFL